MTFLRFDLEVNARCFRYAPNCFLKQKLCRANSGSKRAPKWCAGKRHQPSAHKRMPFAKWNSPCKHHRENTMKHTGCVLANKIDAGLPVLSFERCEPRRVMVDRGGRVLHY